MIVQIKDDDTLSFFLDETAGFLFLEVYVETQQIQPEATPQNYQQGGYMTNPEMSQQWGEYMSLLANEGLPSSCNPDFGTDASSEPDEVDYPIPSEDGPNDVDINIMAENFAQADSIDVPTMKYAKFYNKNEGKLDVGMLFKNKVEPIEAVKDHSIRHARREYYVTESSKTKWKVVCLHSTPGQVKQNSSYGIKHVIQTVKDHTWYDIPYQKAWYSLKMAREIVYCTWESSVQKLPKYMGALKKYNPGTIVEWEHKAFQPSTGAHVIGYVFWAFAPCIEGFQFCRNVISVDGTHLYTKYRHKMLIAAAMDGWKSTGTPSRICNYG
ncbi:UNVERIFIED_CONTAM: hypothetical protein Sradi_1706100 [Sesamum radiatum]|uniref:Transposase n=1 Tax=Sesamum radiatum TaxID=300843 RepID=A0AAW2TT48_SESRA